MKKYLQFSLLAFYAAFVLSSCEDMYDEKIHGNDVVVEENRTISEFHTIKSAGSFDIYYTKSENVSLRIEAEENLLKYIRTEVDDRELELYTKQGYNLKENEPIRIYVSGPEVVDIELIGSGLIECDTIIEDELEIDLTGSGDIRVEFADVRSIDAVVAGSGDIHLAGEANESEYFVSGSGNIRAINLESRNSDAEIIGSGHIYTYVSYDLNAEITGSGNIYYDGNPDYIDKKIYGSGRLIEY